MLVERWESRCEKEEGGGSVFWLKVGVENRGYGIEFGEWKWAWIEEEWCGNLDNY